MGEDEENAMSVQVAEDTDRGADQRETWGSSAEFVLSVVGFAVGLGNVWRFPYLCYKNGGGAFFIPYLLCLLFGGIPMFFLEVGLGQYMSRGGVGAWRITPIFMGIGMCTTITIFMLTSYYNIILAWGLTYMAHSFTSVLPWSHCDNYWNTDRRRVLQISPGIDRPDGVVWELAVALLVAWTLCYFCVWKGVKWTGKVVYFTATFPYVMLSVLFIRGVTLQGSAEGIIFFLKPDFTKLGDSQVWIDAGTQIFFSFAIAINGMIALGSYNKFHNNFYRQCIFISCVNSFTSIFAGFVVFSVLGFMAHEQGVDIADVAESGPGLAFIAYPKAVAQMPLSPVWAVLFFLMILLVGLDSQFVSCEGIITVITDMFPPWGKGRRREAITFILCVTSFTTGITMVTRGGMYVFQLFDFYSASGMVLLWACFFETITIGWIYGGNRFYDNIEMMLGYKINNYLKVCWKYLTPSVTAALFISMWVKFKPLTYNRVYEYPAWAQGIGMCLGFISMVWIPLFFIIKLVTTPGTLTQRWGLLTTPILVPERIPSHWSDSHKLKQIGQLGQNLSDVEVIFYKEMPAVKRENERISFLSI